jgi:hypothetical protein
MNPPGTTSIDTLTTPPPATAPPDTTTVTTTVVTTPETTKMTEAESIGENQNPVIRVMDYDLDLDSVTVSLLIVFMWVTIWYASGLWKTLRYDWVFTFVFLLFILYIVTGVITAGTTSGGIVYELNILLTVEQMIAILLGSAIVFALFATKNLPSPPGCEPIVFRLLMSDVVILLMASLWVNVITTGRAFRFIRKLKQGIYNIALTFLIIVGIIYVKGVRCS